jgi:hypothetical protein
VKFASACVVIVTTVPAGYFPSAGKAGVTWNFPWTGASSVTVNASAAKEGAEATSIAPANNGARARNEVLFMIVAFSMATGGVVLTLSRD